MPTVLQKIDSPEIFIGFVAPIGADLEPSIQAFRKLFENFGYTVVDIRLTNIFKVAVNYIKPEVALSSRDAHSRYDSYIKYGNQIRTALKDDAALAVAAMSMIQKHRQRFLTSEVGIPTFKTVYLVRQFKRKEEVDLFRSVYGRLFFQVSVYSRRGARVDHLSRVFARSAGAAQIGPFRSDAESIVQIDENEVNSMHGQRVAKIFHDADVILSNDAPDSIPEQAGRFVRLLFSSNNISPNKKEYGMFLAKAAALRTLDLSRQVGAAIFSSSGEIISLGSNEVPKAGGGTYWCDEPFDDREYVHGVDSNDRRKREVLLEVAKLLGDGRDIDELMRDASISNSQLMDALEYGRIVHAEMSALSDAARMGRATKGGTLYCTTFPCHMCAKHVVAAGIERVVFLEPYPKSLTFDLHSDSIVVESGDRGRYKDYPKVEFDHFYGVTPRRFRELFERNSRKVDGKYIEYPMINGISTPQVLVDLKFPFYLDIEGSIISRQNELVASILEGERESPKSPRRPKPPSPAAAQPPRPTARRNGR